MTTLAHHPRDPLSSAAPAAPASPAPAAAPPPSKDDDAVRLAARLLAHAHAPYSFAFTPFLQSTYHHGLPADRPICKAYSAGHCPLGARCPERHISASSGRDGRDGFGGGGGGFNSLVCKHWLRGLCKKGEGCEFLHEYNLRKMPECNFYLRNGFCSNGDECLYLHIDPRSKLPPCPDYDNRGFCALGPRCPKKHVRRTLCPYYLAGFCPDGRSCKAGAHPHWSPVAVVAASVAAAAAAAAAREEDAGDADNGSMDGEYTTGDLDEDTAMAGTPDDDDHQQGDRYGQNHRGGFKDKFGGGGGGRGGAGGRWRGRGGSGRGFRGRGGY